MGSVLLAGLALAVGVSGLGDVNLSRDMYNDRFRHESVHDDPQ